MSHLLDTMNKLLAKKRCSLQKGIFIIAESKEDEDKQILDIQEEFNNNKLSLNITVFKLYE